MHASTRWEESRGKKAWIGMKKSNRNKETRIPLYTTLARYHHHVPTILLLDTTYLCILGSFCMGQNKVYTSLHGIWFVYGVFLHGQWGMSGVESHHSFHSACRG